MKFTLNQFIQKQRLINMLKYASKDIRNKITQTFNTMESNTSTILPALRMQNKIKYMNCLEYMQEWSHDLLIRENQIDEKRKQLVELKTYIRQANKNQNRSTNENRCHQNKPSLLPNKKSKRQLYDINKKYIEQNDTQYTINIDQIVQEEFIKKIEKLFMKHFMLSQMDEENNQSLEQNKMSSLDYRFQQRNKESSKQSKNQSDNYGLNMDTYAEKESFQNYQNKSGEYYDI